MPKRDPAYMQGQRDAIARATLEVLLEKGLYGTSLRDICEHAGLSMGSLYVHFRTKQEAVLAAFAIDNRERRYRSDGLPQTRAEYLDGMRQGFVETSKDPVEIRRSRLSLQFVADMAIESANPPGLSDIFEQHTSGTRQMLETLVANGEIHLPLGLENTVDAVRHAAMGASYMLLGNKELDAAEIADGLVALLGLILAEPGRPAA